jgi:hypothetical protein
MNEFFSQYRIAKESVIERGEVFLRYQTWSVMEWSLPKVLVTVCEGIWVETCTESTKFLANNSFLTLENF